MNWIDAFMVLIIVLVSLLILLIIAIHQPRYAQYGCGKYEMQTVTFHRLVGNVPAPRTDTELVCVAVTVGIMK